jgi:hypothetical protein
MVSPSHSRGKLPPDRQQAAEKADSLIENSASTAALHPGALSALLPIRQETGRNPNRGQSTAHGRSAGPDQIFITPAAQPLKGSARI